MYQMKILTAAEWLSESFQRQELAVMNIPLAMELYAKYRETELSRPPETDISVAIANRAQTWFLQNNIDEMTVTDFVNTVLQLFGWYNEAMTRPPKDVVEAIENEFPDVGDKENYECQDDYTVNQIRFIQRTAALHGYSLASGDKWVSVSERYPTEEESEDELLVCLANGHRFTANYLGNIKEYKETGLHFDFVPHENNDITHWQPLPSPPKQQQ